MKIKRHNAGFTLIELLLAMAVCAVVLAAINALFFSAVRLRESTVAAVDATLPVEQALNAVRRDLQGVMLSPSTNKIMSGSFRVGDIGALGLAENVNIEIYTTTGVLRDAEPWAEVQRVAYRLRESAGRAAGKEFVRSVTRNLLATITPTPDDQLLLTHVANLEIECYDGTQWRDSWDTTQSDTNLPTAGRFRIQLAGATSDETRARQPIELVVPISLQTTTNQTATGET